MTNNQQDVNGILRRIIEGAQWFSDLTQDYGATIARLLDVYKRTLAALEPTVSDLDAALSEYIHYAPHTGITGEYVSSTPEFKRLIQGVETEMRDFAAVMRNEAGGLQDRAVQVGLMGALEMAQATSGGLDDVIRQAWRQPADSVLTALIGYVDSAAFREGAAQFGVNAADNLREVILTGVGQGKNPSTTASIIRTWFSVPYAWADNTMRTVQLYSYRTTNHASYAANSDVLDGWMWSASLDDRCCLSCVSQHGTVHKLTETLNDHHRGRCSPIPLVKGTTWINQVQTGQQWFEELNEGRQQQQMGMALWNAWNAGAIQWSDMSHKYQDPVYGDMLREASVKSVLGSEATQYYAINN